MVDIEVIEGVEHKLCKHCGDLHPLTTAFRVLLQGKTGKHGRPYYSSYCRKCESKATKKKATFSYEDWNKSKTKKHHVPTSRWTRLFLKQGEKCAICWTKEPKGKGWCIDHDHNCCHGTQSCGVCVRGILCGKCNTGISMLLEDPNTIRRAADYVERRIVHVRNHSPETRRKLADMWNDERREAQSKIAHKVNAVENEKLRDYLCPDCYQSFEQVTRTSYGAHRKRCLHWKQVGEILEEEMGKTLDEILDSV